MVNSNYILYGAHTHTLTWSIGCFTHLMPGTARAVPGQSQEPRMRAMYPIICNRPAEAGVDVPDARILTKSSNRGCRYLFFL